MIIEIKDLPQSRKIKSIEFKIDFEDNKNTLDNKVVEINTFENLPTCMPRNDENIENDKSIENIQSNIKDLKVKRDNVDIPPEMMDLEF